MPLFEFELDRIRMAMNNTCGKPKFLVKRLCFLLLLLLSMYNVKDDEAAVSYFCSVLL